MIKDFVHSPRHLQALLLHDHVEEAQRHADLIDEYVRPATFRNAIGARLIRIGERLIESPTSELGQSKKAA